MELDDKLEKELAALTQDDLVLADAFASKKAGDEELGVCPPELLKLFIMALRRKGLIEMKELCLEGEAKKFVLAEFYQCWDVFWRILTHEFGNRNLAIRRHGVVVEEKPPFLNDPTVRVLSRLDKIRRQQICKRN